MNHIRRFSLLAVVLAALVVGCIGCDLRRPSRRACVVASTSTPTSSSTASLTCSTVR
jgi:hypothetical protein